MAVQNASEIVTGQNANRNRYPVVQLSKTEKEVFEGYADKWVYIYNVSKIDAWPVKAHKGTVVIQKCEPGKKVSEPTKIPAKFRRQDFNGVRFVEWLEDGMDIAQDICKCSPEYKAMPGCDLTTYGVFITTKPFEDLSEKEQAKILSTANAAARRRITLLLLEGDSLYRDINQHKFIGDIHRAAFLESGESATRHPWGGLDAQPMGVNCQYCGTATNPGYPICPHCNRPVNAEAAARIAAIEKKA